MYLVYYNYSNAGPEFQARSDSSLAIYMDLQKSKAAITNENQETHVYESCCRNKTETIL